MDVNESTGFSAFVDIFVLSIALSVVLAVDPAAVVVVVISLVIFSVVVVSTAAVL